MAFICKSGIQEDNFDDLFILSSTPQRKITRRRHSFCSRSNKDNNKNPYSNRGLDKFEALLADLDGKRQKIFTQKGSEDISLVRFVYTNANDVKPIVVKVKDQKKQEKDHKHKSEEAKTPVSSPEHPVKGGDTVVQLAKPPVASNNSKKSVGFSQVRKKLVEWWRPWYSLPFFVILILVFLVFFERSFAILCTSIGWYLVPVMNRGSLENHKRVKKIMKKEYSRKVSEKMVTSPRSVLNSGAIRTS